MQLNRCRFDCGDLTADCLQWDHTFLPGLLIRFRLTSPTMALLTPITTTVIVIPMDCVLRKSEGVYGRVAACARPMQIALMLNPTIAPVMHHRSMLFCNLYAITANHAAVRIDNT